MKKTVSPAQAGMDEIGGERCQVLHYDTPRACRGAVDVRMVIGCREGDGDDEETEGLPDPRGLQCLARGTGESLERELRVHVTRVDAELAAKREPA